AVILTMLGAKRAVLNGLDYPELRLFRRGYVDTLEASPSAGIVDYIGIADTKKPSMTLGFKIWSDTRGSNS
ncbi:hypothetical protein, partial [Vibrio alfacsensis]|uniref:hypothetical protein n=1 Tax=Vibrio alfacsensis TaxID=1074311 RepID=UPI0040694FA7